MCSRLIEAMLCYVSAYAMVSGASYIYIGIIVMGKYMIKDLFFMNWFFKNIMAILCTLRVCERGSMCGIYVF